MKKYFKWLNPDSFNNIVAAALIIFFALFLIDMWNWFEINHEKLTTQSAGVFGSVVLLVGGALKFALENIITNMDDDNDDS